MTTTSGRPRGFTLIELMASMTVGAIVLIIAVSILGRTGDSYENIGGALGAEREARALLNQLTSDLSSAIYHDDNVFTREGGGWALDKIGFLSLQPSDAQAASQNIGDLCAVNYYIADVLAGGRVIRCLKRGFRNSEATFEALRGNGISGLFQPDVQLDEEIAFGVVSFEARPKIRGASGQLEDWDQSQINSPPQYLDVRLVIARPEMAARLQTSGDWNSSRFLGTPGEASVTRGLEVYQATLRFGNHAP